ncbi:hypothetical protein E4Z66_07245 [Aliishimia ponticola]|uniref:Uncharacterized protein n=1 Tax=Aliishimia ponticola TaxID=2499833 RepID=A0A4S4NDA5_9RHOB|nr:hypothetical protein [Aliishimia ponticola]THH36735.1 hypothetical protein E4Z66_07245 [Aliishimia ponticola]
MTFFGKCAVWPVTTLVLSLSTAAMAGSAASVSIGILCDDPHQTPVCEGMREGLKEMSAGRDVRLVDQASGGLSILLRFVVHKTSAHHLSGQIAWTLRDGATGEGPVIDLSVIDAPLNAEMLRDFGRQLAVISDIPL